MIRERDAVALVLEAGQTLEQQLHLLFADAVLLAKVEAFERDEHLLFFGARQKPHKEADELGVVYTLITVLVDLLQKSTAEHLWAIQIITRKLERQIVFIARLL